MWCHRWRLAVVCICTFCAAAEGRQGAVAAPPRALSEANATSTTTAATTSTSRDIAGSCLSIVSSIISNFGVNLQKLVHDGIMARPVAERVTYTSVPAWWLGLGGVVFGAIGDFIALGLTSQALATALGGSTTLWANVIIARVWLKEKVHKNDLIGVAFIVVGSVGIAVMTPAEKTYTLDDLLDFANRRGFKVYLVVLCLTIALGLSSVASSSFYRARESMLLAVNRPLVRQITRMQQYEHELMTRLEACEEELTDLRLKTSNKSQRAAVLQDRRDMLRRNSRAVLMQSGRKFIPSDSDDEEGDSVGRLSSSLSISLNLGGGGVPAAKGGSERGRRMSLTSEAALARKAESDALVPSAEPSDGAAGAKAGTGEDEGEERWIDAYKYASTAGAIGACSVILAGCTSKTLVAAFEGNNYWDQFAPYGFIGGMVLTITGQQGLLNAAMQHGPLMCVFPVFQAFFIGFGVVGGIVFYQVPLSTAAWVVHILAFAMLLVGCHFLMKHGKRHFEETHGRDTTAEGGSDSEQAEAGGSDRGGERRGKGGRGESRRGSGGRSASQQAAPSLMAPSPMRAPVLPVQPGTASSTASAAGKAARTRDTRDAARRAVAARAGVDGGAIHTTHGGRATHGGPAHSPAKSASNPLLAHSPASSSTSSVGGGPAGAAGGRGTPKSKAPSADALAALEANWRSTLDQQQSGRASGDGTKSGVVV
eukprot:g6586.t1